MEMPAGRPTALCFTAALDASDRLAIAVHEATRRFPVQDRPRLGRLLRSGAGAVLTLVALACRDPTSGRAQRFVEAAERGLRRLGGHIALAERLGLIGPRTALELLELRSGAQASLTPRTAQVAPSGSGSSSSTPSGGRVSDSLHGWPPRGSATASSPLPLPTPLPP